MFSDCLANKNKTVETNRVVVSECETCVKGIDQLWIFSLSHPESNKTWSHENELTPLVLWAECYNIVYVSPSMLIYTICFHVFFFFLLLLVCF